MTKILLITSEFPPQPGGIGTHAYHVAKQLSEHNLKVHVLTDQRSVSGAEEKVFDQQLPFEVTRVKRKNTLLFSYLKRISKAIGLSKQVNVMLLSGKFSLWIGGLLSLVSGKKLIAVIHGSELLLQNKLLRKYTGWCLQRFDHVIAVSDFTLSLAASLKLKHTSVIPNGFEIPAQEDFVKKRPQELSLITIGNVTQRKGQHNVVKALPLLQKEHPTIKYHIVGIPTQKDELQALAKELNVEDHLVFHGRVNNEQKIKLLCEASIFMMLSETTSTGDVEGFGIAILEANALGVPAIGALGCGIEDAILDGRSGKLIPSDQPKVCKEAIDEILMNYPYFREQAKEWTTQFEWPTVIKQYLNVIKDL